MLPRWTVCIAALGLIARPALAAADGFPWGRYQRQTDTWFKSDEAKQIAQNVLSHQTPHGDWPKNLDTGAAPYQGDPAALKGTFDNSATLGEIRFLARLYRITGDGRYQAAMLKAVDHVLAAQYSNGGWPQHAPPPANAYHRHITFNDGCMVNLMVFVRDLGASKEFDMLDALRRQRAREAFDRGIQCILRCQIRVQGKLTVWWRSTMSEPSSRARPAVTSILRSAVRRAPALSACS